MSDGAATIGDPVVSARAAARRLHRALDAIRDAVRADDLWRSGDCVVLGCSAGVDSIVAWELLARLRSSLGHALHVVQIDHGLRADADVVAAAMDAMATRHAMAWHRVDAPIAAGAPQLEANARVGRYRALERMAAQLGAPVIAIAHHADDQAETVLMRLARGAGLSALGAMRSERIAHHGDSRAEKAGNAEDAENTTERDIDEVSVAPTSVRVVRPMLGLRRSEIAAIADDLGLVWVEDPSNSDPRHERNRIRHEVLPRLEAIRPGAASGITRSAHHAAAAADAVSHWLRIVLLDHGRWQNTGTESAEPAGSDDANDANDANDAGQSHRANPDGTCVFSLPARLWPQHMAPLGVLLAELSSALGIPAPSDRATRQVCAWLKVATIGSVTEIHGLTIEHRGELVAIVRNDVARLSRGTYLGSVRSRHGHAAPSSPAPTDSGATGLSGSRGRARSNR